MTKEMIKVYVYEMDRVFGRKLDEIREFDNKEQAKQFMEKINSKNNKPQVPEWYEYATMDRY